MATATTSHDLETGWRSGTPAADTVLRHGTVAMAVCWAAIGDASRGRVSQGNGYTAVDLGRPSGLFNSAVLLQPRLGADRDRSLTEIEAFFDGDGRGRALLWSPWPTPDLTGRGWTLEGHPPLLYRPPRPPGGADRPPELSTSPVDSASDLDVWRTVAVEAFPFDDVRPATDLFGDDVLGDPRFRFVVGHADQEAVAAACQFVDHGVNVLLLAATSPRARGRGYYSALAADRLAAQPELPAVAIVSDDSRPILVGRFGFLPVTRFTLWSRDRP